MTAEIVCIPVTADGQVAHGWGKAPAVAVARVDGGDILEWRVESVGWDVLHDSGEGNHHARVVRFVRDNEVTIVVAGHMGPPMQEMLGKLGVLTVLGAEGDARDEVVRITTTATG